MKLENFLRITFRYLWRNRTYSLLNYVCLTFGLSCALIALIYILNILSYDKFHENYNRLYSVDAYITYFNGDRFPKEHMSASMAEILMEQAPEIEETTRVTECEFSFINDDKVFAEKGIYADSNFFNIFTFPLTQSSRPFKFNDLNSIVISEPMAMKFFGNSNCLGKILVLKNGDKEESFKVSGVFQTISGQSSMKFNFVLPFSKFLADNHWALDTGATACQTWILLKDKTNFQLVENKIKNLIKNQESTLNQELFLFPLKDIVLYSYASGKRVWKGMQKLVIVASIGFAILLIACFNFINLAIALNMRRYREAGMKKVVGSRRYSIIFQFLGETLLITTISIISAILLDQIFLPELNTLFNTDLLLDLLDIKIIMFLGSIMLFTVLVSGFLPALFLSSLDPLSILKGRMVPIHNYSIFRQSLIILQFTIPIVLIIIAIIINTQDNYMRNYEIGVDKDRLIIVENSPTIQQHSESIRSELMATPEIDALSFNSCIPTRGTSVTTDVSWEGKDASEKLHFWCINADFEYNRVININIVEGRYFNPVFTSDSVNYVVNDVALSAIKNKTSLGSSLILEGKKGTIIGIIKDFHAIDLSGPLVPVIIRISPYDKNYLMIRFSSGSFASINRKIQSVFKHYDPNTPVQATLFRDLHPYTDLSVPSKLASLSFFIALLLACTGLFGLASFTTESRTKEIGIRKVNGAPTLFIMRLLLISYTKCLTIAFFLALPLAFLVGKIFLSRFYFHTPMPLFAFLAGPLIAAIIALFTVSSLSWRAARRNPIEALRYE